MKRLHMAGVIVAVLMLAPGLVGAQLFGMDAGGAADGTPRVGTPSAHLLGEQETSAYYSFRGASYEGRDMASNQYGVAVGITSKIELGWDRHELDVDGRNAGNTFDTWSTGWQVRYAADDLLGGDGAYFVQLRRSRGQAVQGGALRIPPRATTWTFGAVTSRPFRGDNEVHIRLAAAHSEVGNADAWTFIGGAGIDHPLTSSLTLGGDATLFHETGDIQDTEVALTGTVRYHSTSGFFADASGTWLPSGTPIAGNPLADGSVFVLDPVFAAEPIVRDFRSDSLGFYLLRAGYTTDF